MAFTIYHPSDLLAHPVKPGHPERPHRLVAALASLGDIAHDFDYKVADPASLEDAELLHSPAYLASLAEPFGIGQSFRVLDGGDTVQTPDTLNAALCGLGAARRAVDALHDKTAQGAFVMSRPPGHHAHSDHASGFCFLGTAALAAKYAAAAYGMRVALIDFDLHHGDGHQQLLWDEKNIFLASTHQEGIYPMSGQLNEVGAHDHIMNRPLVAGSSSTAMRHAWTEIFDALRSFNPDMIIVSAGFDAHADDPLSGLKWSIDDYAWLGEQIAEIGNDLCEGKILNILEGGYDLSVLRHAIPQYLAPIVAASGAKDDAGTAAPILDKQRSLSPYLAGNTPLLGKKGDDRFACVKANTRLWIQDQTTGAMVYTPPEFLQMQSREPIKALASVFNTAGGADIEAIISFEHHLTRGFGYTKRSSDDFA